MAGLGFRFPITLAHLPKDRQGGGLTFKRVEDRNVPVPAVRSKSEKLCIGREKVANCHPSIYSSCSELFQEQGEDRKQRLEDKDW